MLPGGYAIRELEVTDAAALSAAYVRNRAHLARTQPLRPEAYFTEAGQEQDVRARVAAHEAGTDRTWVVTHGADVVGRVTLSNVVRGPLQAGNLGYWVDHEHTGRGLATAGVEVACAGAAEWGLHRVEAGTLVDNVASQAVLRKCGFTEIGTAAAYLFIDGAWRDHRLFQRILGDEPPR